MGSILSRVFEKFVGELERAPIRFTAWQQNQRPQQPYHFLSVDSLQQTRRSDIVLIFGAGYSLNDITAEMWAQLAAYDTMGFNYFVHQDFIRMDYHLIREIGGNDRDPNSWQPRLDEYARLIGKNPHYRDTVFLVQGGWRAINGNRMIGLGKLPANARIFRFKNKSPKHPIPPSRTFTQGLVHSYATLIDCVNFAYILGWRHIVLVGVDLYDRRYFWLKENETRDIDAARGNTHQDTHNTAQPVIQFLGYWHDLLATEGITLSVHNPRSLLAEVMPVYEQTQSDS